MRDTVGILGPHYTVGELELDVESLVNKREVLSRHDMPDMPDLWGWGYYRKTEGSRVDLACSSALGTLHKAALKGPEIDALILCCGDALNYYAQNRLSGELATRLGLGYCSVNWVGGAGCASLFSAIKIAHALVTGAAYRSVLVISMDKIDDDALRFQRYGVLSDGACSLVVSRSEAIDFAIIGAKVLSCPASLSDGGQDFQEKCQLISAVFEGLVEQWAPASSHTTAYFGSNVFIPIQELELSVMPLDELISYQENTTRYGHCYSADPVINLIDFYANGANRAVKHAILAATAHGHFGLILLEKRNR